MTIALTALLAPPPWAKAASTTGPTPSSSNGAAPACPTPPGSAAPPAPAGPSASACAPAVAPPPAPATQDWAVYAQSTFTEQYHPAFASAYQGAHSLDPGSRGDETLDITLYGGVRPWRGAEIWVNPEVEQGFGLSNTFGVAGFPSAESYKLGADDPYVRLQRLFLRQTIDLGGATETVDADLNQLAGTQDADRLVLWLGKFAVPDIFDTNKFAHDARHDFLNWSLIDAGSFDYAGDAWGYSYGAAAEWYQDWWAVRGGVVDLPTRPASEYLNPRFGQEQFLLELEERHTAFGQDGKVRLTGFLTRGELGSFNDALALAVRTDTVPSTAAVLNYRSRGGVSLDAEQQLTANIGAFLRAGTADGSAGTTAFTDVDKTLSLGLSITGAGWHRPNDTVGLGFAENDVSRQFKSYLAAGGLATLIGDGQLPRSGPEHIVEAYYSLPLARWANLTADYQFIDSPAYSTDRGPVSVLSARLHLQI